MFARWLAMAIFATAALAATAVSPYAAEAAPPARLLPVDEATKDRSFVKFRDDLSSVIARKGAAALFNYLAPDIKIDYGGGAGTLEFHERWKPFNKDTKIWKALSLVVGNGGRFQEGGSFAAPYVFAAFPDGFDAFEVLVVTNKNAVMREAPKHKADIIRKLDHDILTVVQTRHQPQHEAGLNDWSEVKDANGKHGFVLDQDVRSPIDFRAIFEKRKGQWVMAVFIAGD